MNIFLCCLQSNLVSHHFWRENFKTSLEAMGHTVFEPEGLDLLEPLFHVNDRKWIERQRAVTSQELRSQVKAVHDEQGVDLFLSYFWSVHVHGDAIREIERFGIPTVNYFCDNLREFERVSEIINSFTLNWVPEKKACELYESRKAPHIYLPMSADPRFYQPHHADELPQLSFVGSADYMRRQLLASVFDSGLPLRIYGRQWITGADEFLEGEARVAAPDALTRISISSRQHWQRLRLHGLAAEWRHLSSRNPPTFKHLEKISTSSISHQEMVNLTSNSAVVLGINRCPHPGYPKNSPLVYSRLRDVEAPMMGACYLTEYCDDVAELYDIGREVAVYRTPEELISEATRLLEDKDARKSLRELGHKAAVSRHTWAHRFERLFAALGLREKKEHRQLFESFEQPIGDAVLS
jgi:hypothetical protein